MLYSDIISTIFWYWADIMIWGIHGTDMILPIKWHDKSYVYFWVQNYDGEVNNILYFLYIYFALESFLEVGVSMSSSWFKISDAKYWVLLTHGISLVWKGIKSKVTISTKLLTGP